MPQRTLLVEGSDERHVFKALFEFHAPAARIEIKEMGGDGGLRRAWLRLLESDVETVGIVIDADADIVARWTAIREHVSSAGYPSFPATPVQEGLILDPPRGSLLPRLGVWMMPDNTREGSIEHFLFQMIPDGDGLFAYAGTCVQGIPPGLRLFKEQHQPKALIRTWLAWQEKPGILYDQSIVKGVLRTNCEAVERLFAWIDRLFTIF